MPIAPLTNRQRTLAASAEIEGVGLFTAAPVRATIHPAPADTGIVFRRTDLPGSPPIPARVENIIDRPRRTVLRAAGDPNATIETVEHCLSALSGLGVDNAVVDVDGPELPIGDGSASFIVDAVCAAGVVEQDAPRRTLVVREPITVRAGSGQGGEDEAILVALPNDSPVLELLYDLDYGSYAPVIGRQVAAFTLRPDDFHPAHAHNGATNGTVAHATHCPYATRIAPARTYALLEEARAMRERGMFSHLSPRDMLVIGEDGPVDNELRFADEPVRHKLLDLLGDLALVGRPIQGRIIASRSGHALNHLLARALIEQARRLERSTRRTDPDYGRPVAMDIKDVMRLLPHRYPMVLVDRVLEMDGDRRAVGIKNVTVNEPFFQGHYPGSPIMPGVLIVEAMGQLAGLMLSQKLERTGKIAVLLSMDRVKLRKPVVPGDQLVMETEALKATERFGDVQCRARVDGRLVAEARIKFMMVDAEPQR